MDEGVEAAASPGARCTSPSRGVVDAPNATRGDASSVDDRAAAKETDCVLARAREAVGASVAGEVVRESDPHHAKKAAASTAKVQAGALLRASNFKGPRAA